MNTINTTISEIVQATHEFIKKYGMEPSDALLPSPTWDAVQDQMSGEAGPLRHSLGAHHHLRMNGLLCHEWSGPCIVVCITNL